MNYNLKRFKYYIFDFDGVIVDSVNIKTQAFKELYRPFGNDIESLVAQHHLSHGGLSRFDKIAHYHQVFLNKKLSKDEIEALASKFSSIVYEKVIKAKFIKGSLDFLKKLKSESKHLFIISGTPEEEIRLIIMNRGLDVYFEEILGSPGSKNDNLVYLIKKFGINPSLALYFGDSQEDQKAACFSEIDFVPINYFEKSTGFKNFKEFLKVCKI